MSRMTFRPCCLPTGIGSLPHTDPAAAIDLIRRFLPAIPFWPQLPNRSFLENMYVQYSPHLAGIRLDQVHERIHIELDDNLLAEVESFYGTFLEEDPAHFALNPDYAAGLFTLLEHTENLRDAAAIKGQITGPISFGLKVTDQNLRPSLYDDTVRDVLVKSILRQAQWQEATLRSLGHETILFIDEPSLALVGSAYVALNRDEVVRDLEEVFGGLTGLKGVHCCGNTDWSLLLETTVDVISFDAYSYTENFVLYADGVRAFLDRGGLLAWGLIPTTAEDLARATGESLVARFEMALGQLSARGIDREALLDAALVTPACGLGTLLVPIAERALELTRGVSDQLRRNYKLG